MKKFFTSMVLFLSAVTLSAATAATEPTDTKTVVATLLDTPQSVGSWSNTIEVAGSLLSEAGAKAGDCLRVTYTVTEEGAQLQLSANVPSWHNIYPCTDVASSEKYVELQLTAEMIESIVADKLYIQGKQLTVESVQLVRDGVEDGVQNISFAVSEPFAAYTLVGVRLSEKPRCGVYIMNGKKFIVR